MAPQAGMGNVESAETYSQVYDIQQLIAMPLLATVDADFYAAQKFVEYIRKYGFAEGSGSDWGELRTITFAYFTINAQGQKVRNTVTIPALSLIPLPLLQVKDAQFDMDIRILGMVSWPTPPTCMPRKQSTFAGDSGDQTVIKAALSPLRQDKISELAPNLVANLRARVAMSQADIPAGIGTLLSIMQSAAQSSLQVLNRVLALSASVIDVTEQATQVTVTCTGNDGILVPGAEIDMRVVRGEDWLVVEPASVKTNSAGSATVGIHAYKASENEGGIYFSAANAAPVLLTVINKLGREK